MAETGAMVEDLKGRVRSFFRLCMACAATIAPALPNAPPEPSWLLLAGG